MFMFICSSSATDWRVSQGAPCLSPAVRGDWLRLHRYPEAKAVSRMDGWIDGFICTSGRNEGLFLHNMNITILHFLRLYGKISAKPSGTFAQKTQAKDLKGWCVDLP